jgi:hypothetical protein
LAAEFAHRLVSDLSSNNTLRGTWAEHLVAHFLGIEDFPPNWSYYDMRDASGRDISVKHSVGRSSRFSVAMSEWAWLPSPRARPDDGGWLRSADAGPQYWCHTYVFAWLEHDTSTPPLDAVLDPDRWAFSVLSRQQMYERFTDAGKPLQKTVACSALGTESFKPGTELAALVAATPFVADNLLVPLRSMVPWKEGRDASPVEVVLPEDVIE